MSARLPATLAEYAKATAEMIAEARRYREQTIPVAGHAGREAMQRTITGFDALDTVARNALAETDFDTSQLIGWADMHSAWAARDSRRVVQQADRRLARWALHLKRLIDDTAREEITSV